MTAHNWQPVPEHNYFIAMRNGTHPDAQKAAAR